MIRPLRLAFDLMTRPRRFATEAAEPSCVSLGCLEIDARLHGGIQINALHEFYAAGPDDAAATAGFALMLAICAAGERRSVVWIREDRGVRQAGGLYGTGLAELGFDPDTLILVQAADTRALLRAAADSVKCAQVGAVVIEPWGKAPLLDLTASRRLAMAAASSGVFTLMLRIDAVPMPSAAQTRWQVAAAPSTALAANAPGHPAFDITLLRHRGGVAGFEARLEWNRDKGSFAPLSGGSSAAAVVGTGATRASPATSTARRAA